MTLDPTHVPTVTFEDAAARLERLPATLPAGPEELIPVLIETGERPARAAPDLQPVRPAAVLVLIVPGPGGEARVILTERADRGGHHSGEVSFPGGSAEPGDADLTATAVREAIEETGLDPQAVGMRIVCVLEPFWIPVSGFLVTPVVAVADRRPTLVPAEDEVARILEVPLAAFLPGAPMEVVERTIRGWSLRYSAYPIEGLSVWGATARILGQLGMLIAQP